MMFFDINTKKPVDVEIIYELFLLDCAAAPA